MGCTVSGHCLEVVWGWVCVTCSRVGGWMIGSGCVEESVGHAQGLGASATRSQCDWGSKVPGGEMEVGEEKRFTL